MSIVTLAQAKAQGRITETSEDALIQGYIDAAEQTAMRYLNRNVYADATAFTADMATAGDTLSAAQALWLAAQTTYQVADEPSDYEEGQRYVYTNPLYPLPDDLASIIYEAADAQWREAKETYAMIAYGKVTFPAFEQAVVLLTQGWYANRENMTFDVGTTAELPEGFRQLLFPWRVRMGV